MYVDSGAILRAEWPADTLRERIVRYLLEHGESSISELGRNLKYPLANVREKLDIAERHGHVRLQKKQTVFPSGQRAIIHGYTITKEGEKWLALAEQS